MTNQILQWEGREAAEVVAATEVPEEPEGQDLMAGLAIRQIEAVEMGKAEETAEMGDPEARAVLAASAASAPGAVCILHTEASTFPATSSERILLGADKAGLGARAVEAAPLVAVEWVGMVATDTAVRILHPAIPAVRVEMPDATVMVAMAVMGPQVTTAVLAAGLTVVLSMLPAGLSP